MALAGILATGSRFLTFLQPRLMMNSEEYSRMMNFSPKKIAKKNNLMIVHDRSKVHIAKRTQAFFKNNQLKSLLLPGESPDLNPIEHCFGLFKKKLER